MHQWTHLVRVTMTYFQFAPYNRFQWNLNKIRRKIKIGIFSSVACEVSFSVAQCHFSWLSAIFSWLGAISSRLSVLAWSINGIADSAIKSHYSDVIMSTVPNHQPHDCLLNGLFKRRSKKTLKAAGHWPLWGEFAGDRWISRTKGQ